MDRAGFALFFAKLRIACEQRRRISRCWMHLCHRLPIQLICFPKRDEHIAYAFDLRF